MQSTNVELTSELNAAIKSGVLCRLMRDGQKVVYELNPGEFYTVLKQDHRLYVHLSSQKEIESVTSYDKIMDAMVKSMGV